MSLEDKQLRRRAERELAKFPIDVTRLFVRAQGDTIHLEGRIRLDRKGEGKTADLRKTLLAIEECLRALPQVRDVITAGLQRDFN